MVVELGADLLPDVADTGARAQIYESLYGGDRCLRGFVAMRIEWPDEAEAAIQGQGAQGSTASVEALVLDSRLCLNVSCPRVCPNGFVLFAL